MNSKLGERRKRVSWRVPDGMCIVSCLAFAHGRMLEFKYNIQGVNDTRNVTQDGQQDVDEEVRIASALKENTERGEENGEDDLDEVACGERHCESVV